MIPASIQTSLLHLPLDWVIIALLAFFLVIYTLRTGTRAALALALSLPVAALVLGAMPSTVLLSGMMHQISGPLVQLILSVVVFFILYVLVFRMLDPGFMGGTRLFTALCVGLAATVVTVAFFNDILGSNAIWHFGSQVQTIFGATYRLWWLLASYVVLAFVRR